jgi:glycosyltransferase involved in cell wall biosynthesis
VTAGSGRPRRPTRQGLVSIVVVIPDGAAPDEHLERVEALEWPADRRETLVVTSGDRPLGTRSASAPAVRVIGIPRGVSIAEARNLAAAEARGEYLAFFGPRTTPDPGWLRTAMDVVVSDATVGAVAGKVVDADRSTVRFVDAALSFDGRPRFPGAGKAVDPVTDQSGDVLFASEAAMLVETAAFHWSGGFDAEHAAGVESADLGWRLWLHGFRIRYEPAAVAYDASPVENLSDAETRLGALGMLFKNYGQESLDAALAGALLLDVGRGEPVAARFLAALPALSGRRHTVQARRTRPESEVLPLFRDPLTAEPDEEQTNSNVRVALGLDRIFAQRHRVVVVTPDVLQSRMAGPAIRAWHMAVALSREHDVELVTTSLCSLTHADFPVRHVGDAELHELEAWCDVLIFQGHVLDSHPWLQRSSKILVVDIYDPFHLEVLEQSRDQSAFVRRETVRLATEVLNQQLGRGDYFLCASEKQRDFWLGQLAGVGRINPATYDATENLDQLISVVPFGVGDDPPVHDRQVLKGVVPGIGTEDKVILWGGGVYNWFDPVTLVHAVDNLRARVPNVRLYFMGMRHPNPTVPAMAMASRTQALADELGLVDKHVFFNADWVAYEERHNYLLEADVGVSTHLDQVETEFSFRTRILDYIWAGLPVVATCGDAVADLIEHHGLGTTVPPGDVEALEGALYRLVTDQDANRRCRDAIAAFAPNLRWERVLGPLKAFCKNPRRAPDLVDPRQRVMIGDPMAQAVWGTKGWRDTLRTVVDHARRGEYDEITRKIRMRLRLFMYPEAGGPAARS